MLGLTASTPGYVSLASMMWPGFLFTGGLHVGISSPAWSWFHFMRLSRRVMVCWETSSSSSL